MTGFTYLIAEPKHIPAIEALQAENLVSELTEEQQKANGFVTTPFTQDQLERLIAQQGMFLTFHEDTLVAYAVSASWRYFSEWAIFRHMVSMFEQTPYRDTIMTMENSYQYGPICIKSPWRGQGILQALFAFARAEMAKRYPYGLTFVNQRNPRSFTAHHEKLGLDSICEFGFNDQRYWMLGFLTDESREESAA